MSAHCKLCGLPIFTEGQCYGTMQEDGTWLCNDTETCKKMSAPVEIASWSWTCGDFEVTKVNSNKEQDPNGTHYQITDSKITKIAYSGGAAWHLIDIIIKEHTLVDLLRLAMFLQ